MGPRWDRQSVSGKTAFPDVSEKLEVRGEDGGGAIAQVFRDHHRALIRWLAVQLGDYEDACDVAQEAYTRLLRQERSNTIGYLRAYLFKIAANLAIDRIRARALAGRFDASDILEGIGLGSDSDNDVDPLERAAAAAQEAKRFWETLRELPLQYRQAVVMSRVQDLSCEQIAALLDMTSRSVRRYIARALTYCRLRLLGASSDQARAGMTK